MEDKNYKLSSGDKILKWSFRVPNKISKLNMTLKGKVWSNSTEKWINLDVSKEFDVVNHQQYDDKYVLFDLDLTHNETKGYILKAIGKNGEPFENINIRIVIAHNKLSKQTHHLVRTDTSGSIYLGKLPGVASISAEIMPTI
mmetsp:Transcript_17908/g.15652  ORF Transcript_17908/g.15652 Transcript_17908/m.15652 type:complete len:142 (+) Transcript_17908:471-896(+)